LQPEIPWQEKSQDRWFEAPACTNAMTGPRPRDEYDGYRARTVLAVPNPYMILLVDKWTMSRHKDFFAQMSKWALMARHQCEDAGIPRRKTKIENEL
jgi:hypothetical protein